MADKNVFEQLSEQLEALPEQLQEIYEDVTIETVDTYFYDFASDLQATSGSNRLNQNMTVYQPSILKGRYYKRSLDWSDKPVNPNRKYTKDKVNRARRKRNFSKFPATYHDLAYIINYGHTTDKGTIISGTYFIDKARRKLKRWEAQRDRKFRKAIRKIYRK